MGDEKLLAAKEHRERKGEPLIFANQENANHGFLRFTQMGARISKFKFEFRTWDFFRHSGFSSLPNNELGDER